MSPALFCYSFHLYLFLLTTLYIFSALAATWLAKYHPSQRFALQSLIHPQAALALTQLTFSGIGFLSPRKLLFAKSTWGKYALASNAFSCFEAYSCESFSWPLSRETSTLLRSGAPQPTNCSHPPRGLTYLP
jgi:hypothetical protein